MSQVAYYLSCRLKTKVTGFLCSAPNVNMVASGKSPSRKNTKVNIPEGNEKSCCQQEENRLNAGANKRTLLRSQVVDFLNDRLKIHEDRKDHEEDQKYEDKQNELLMSQAACDLGCRLKTGENDADEDEDVHVAEAEIIQESRAPSLIGEVPKVDVQRVPEDSLEECAITRSSSYGPTDSSQPHGDTDEITFEEDNVDSALVAGSPSSHDVVKDALIILSEDRKDHEEDQKYEDKQNELLMSLVACDLGCRLKTGVGSMSVGISRTTALNTPLFDFKWCRGTATRGRAASALQCPRSPAEGALEQGGVTPWWPSSSNNQKPSFTEADNSRYHVKGSWVYSSRNYMGKGLGPWSRCGVGA
ncbi:uncharacterized protein LOC120360200 isoform X4 [Saimiri boliviensis]